MEEFLNIWMLPYLCKALADTQEGSNYCYACTKKQHLRELLEDTSFPDHVPYEL